MPPSQGRKRRQVVPESPHIMPIMKKRSRVASPSSDDSVLGDVEDTEPSLCRAIALDIGSTSTRSCFSLLGHSSSRIFSVDFNGQRNNESLQTPTKLMYERQGDKSVFVCGWDLQKKLNDGTVSSSDVITNMKLGFFEHADSTEHRIRLDEQLKKHNKTRMDMIEDYLRFLIQKTTDSMASKFGLSPGVLAMSDLVLYISQPDMINPESNKPLCEAGKRAGASQVRVCHESVCLAATLYIDECNDRVYAPHNLFGKPGDTTGILDIGGAFGCTTSQRLNKEVHAGGVPGLETVNSSMSQPCGSTAVDRAFQKLLPQLEDVLEHGGLEVLASKLGYNVPDFHYQATSAFIDKAKKEFSATPTDGVYRIHVMGARKADMPSWIAELEWSQVELLFIPVVAKILETLQTRFRDARDNSQCSINTLILGGGMAANPYVNAKVTEAMSKQGVKVMDRTSHDPCAVARGCLLRYRNCSNWFTGHARSFNLAMPMDEIADPETDHPDILERWETRTVGKGKKAKQVDTAVYHDSLVMEGLYDNDIWARDRLHWLVRCDSEADEDFYYPEEWSVEYPALGVPYEYAPRLIWSEASELREHEPLLQLNGEIQEHLKYFSTEPLRVQHPETERWEVYTHKKGRKTWYTYRIAICTKVFVSDAGFAIKRIIRPYSEMQQALKDKTHKQDWNLATDEREVLDPNYSHLALGGA